MFMGRSLVAAGKAWAATNSLARNGGPPGVDAKTFYIIPMTDMLIFAVLVIFCLLRAV